MPGGRIDVNVIDSYAYELIYKDPQDTVYRTLEISNPNGATDFDTLEVTETGSRSVFSRFVWDEATQTWTLEQGTSSTEITTTEKVSGTEIDSETRTETRELIDTYTNVVADKQVETIRRYPWGERVIQIEYYPDLAAGENERRITTYEYYTDPVVDGVNLGRLRSFTNNEGYWKRYAYDQEGRTVEIIKQLNGNALDESDLPALRSNNIVETFAYFDAELSDADATNESVTKTTVQSQGVQEQATYEINWSQSNPEGTADPALKEKWTVRPSGPDPESGYGSTTAFLDALLSDANNLGHEVSKVRRQSATGAIPYAQSQAISADGRVTLYAYPVDGTTVVTRGLPDSTGTGIDDGSRTTTEQDESGNAVQTYTEVIDPLVNSGAWTAKSLAKTLASDAFGRPTLTGHYVGAEAAFEVASSGTGIAAYTTAQTYGCCGVESRTDRYGQVTTYTPDFEGRIASTTRPDGVTLHYTYDAAGRQVKVEREGLGQSPTVDAESSYDLAGRQIRTQDAGSKFTYTTYRKVKPDGSAYVVGTDTGPFLQERRTYPHSNATGPVRVTWTNSQSNVVRQWTGSTTASWSDTTPPTGTESLTELSRTTTDYDWNDRPTQSFAYHDLTGLSLNATGTEGTHYYVLPGGVYDTHGHLVKSEDAAGNVTVTVFDGDHRPAATWAGVNDGSLPTDATSYDEASLPGLGLVQVASTGYDADGEATSARRLKAVASLSNFETQDSVETNYDDTYLASGNAVTGRESWSQPADGLSPWTKQVYDAQGRMTESVTYANGSTSQILTKTTNVYAPDTTQGSSTLTGRMIASRTHEVTSGGGLTGNYLETTYAYDSAGRQFKTGQTGGGFSITLYDAVGRVARSLVVADDNGTATEADDVVASETVYGYDAADNVIWTEQYARRHDASATATGLLSSQPALADVSYAATWYDDAHRPTHQADYGDTAP